MCGAVKQVIGGVRYVCNLEGEHEIHGVCERPGLKPYVRWPVALTAEEEQRRLERYEWRKPHVRREYQTLKQWKAKQ